MTAQSLFRPAFGSQKLFNWIKGGDTSERTTEEGGGPSSFTDIKNKQTKFGS